MNFLLPSSTYKYLKAISPWFLPARRLLKQISGVEPTLFFAAPLVDDKSGKFKPKVVEKLLRQFESGKLPLSNRAHGVRVHGLIDFGRGSNRVFYARDIDFSVTVLTEQIELVKQLVTIAGVDDRKLPSLLTIHLGQSEGDRSAELARLVEVFKKVLPLAEGKRVIISIENMFDPRGGYSLGSDLEDLAAIFSGVGPTDWLTCTFDFSHALIHYHGNYQRIEEQLVKLNLLPKICFVHLTAPGIKYREKVEKYILPPRNFFPINALWYLLFHHPDNQSGFLPLFKKHPGDYKLLLPLINFVLDKSAVKESRYNVATLELELKVWGTHAGATVKDMLYTLKTIKAFDALNKI
ncbi:MAG: TIM barrel protein [Patescibacteria group bacterium]|jgi:hypothetical protein